MDASEERFRRLARSSPWRWRTLRFTVRYTGERPMDEPVRGWIRRPDGIRVETLDGTVRRAERQQRSAPVLLTTDGRGATVPPPAAPRLDADGLVTERPWPDVHEDPMHDNYFWVAMLDPVELSDGVDVDDVRTTTHHGRPAWEALLRPRAGYDPRCPCCALLWGEVSAEQLAGDGEPVAPPDRRFADAHLVRLDVATGVCVLTEEVGGSEPGRGHDLVIEAVDEALPDELFAKGGVTGRST